LENYDFDKAIDRDMEYLREAVEDGDADNQVDIEDQSNNTDINEEYIEPGRV
jgi:hypothetical protein